MQCDIDTQPASQTNLLISVDLQAPKMQFAFINSSGEFLLFYHVSIISIVCEKKSQYISQAQITWDRIGSDTVKFNVLQRVHNFRVQLTKQCQSTFQLNISVFIEYLPFSSHLDFPQLCQMKSLIPSTCTYSLHSSSFSFSFVEKTLRWEEIERKRN